MMLISVIQSDRIDHIFRSPFSEYKEKDHVSAWQREEIQDISKETGNQNCVILKDTEIKFGLWNWKAKSVPSKEIKYLKKKPVNDCNVFFSI